MGHFIDNISRYFFGAFALLVEVLASLAAGVAGDVAAGVEAVDSLLPVAAFVSDAAVAGAAGASLLASLL